MKRNVLTTKSRESNFAVHKRTSSWKRLSAEQGAFFVLFAVCIVLIIGILALVIDVSRIDADTRQAQNLADSMSLAGAQALDGTSEGWANAKLAALVALKRHRKIVGFVGDSRTFEPSTHEIKWDALELVRGEQDPYAFNAHYRGNKGTLGNLEIEIERGVYWEERADEELQFEFFPLESTEDRQRTLTFGSDPYVVANAVRVTLRLGGEATAFGSTLGVSKLPVVERTSVATIGNDIEECVLPVAVPLCQVMRDTELGKGWNARTDEYNAPMQCGRELLAAEANLETDPRLDGVTRYLSYPLPEMVPMNGTNNECVAATGYPAGLYPNCKASTIFATMGLPESASDPVQFGSPTSPREINRILTSGLHCVSARLGTRFRSMNSAVDNNGLPFVEPGHTGNRENGFLQMSAGSDLEVELVRKINNGGVAFSTAFGDPSGPFGNYPSNRVLYRTHGLDNFSELRLTWPTSDGSDFGMGIMLMRPKGGEENPFTNEIQRPQDDWVNPACHTPGVTGESVLPVKIMVIAPTAEGVNYCNHSSYITAVPDAQIPSSDTDPRVVGFLDAYLYDFHLRLHAAGDPVLVDSSNDPDHDTLLDNNAWQLTGTNPDSTGDLSSWFQRARHYLHERSRWEACESERRACERDEDGSSGQCEECASPPSPPDSPDLDPIQSSLRDLVDREEGEGRCFKSAKSCFNSTAGNNYQDVISQEKCVTNLIPSLKGRQVEDDKQRMDLLDPWATGIANDGKTCLPIKKRGRPSDRPGSWEVRDLSPQYLCGGLRLRLSCNQNDMISIGNNSGGAHRPIIVSQ